MSEKIYGNYSVDELDEQYNKRAEVPDHEAYFERWKSDSESARHGVTARQGISYGSGERETMDIFPAHARGAPVVVFIHGGYWQALDKSYFSFIAPPLVERGFSVVVLNYPLCPAVRLRDIVRSLRWAMVYLYRHLDACNGDWEKLYLVGHSAGGHLAAMLLATAWPQLDSALRPPFVTRAISLSGVFELEPLRYTYVNQALRLDQSEIDDLSPANLAPPTAGSLDLLVGEKESDEFKRQSRHIGALWSGGEFHTSYQIVQNHNHFSILDELVRPGGVILTLLDREQTAPDGEPAGAMGGQPEDSCLGG